MKPFEGNLDSTMQHISPRTLPHIRKKGRDVMSYRLQSAKCDQDNLVLANFNGEMTFIRSHCCGVTTEPHRDPAWLVPPTCILYDWHRPNLSGRHYSCLPRTPFLKCYEVTRDEQFLPYHAHAARSTEKGSSLEAGL
ncbi:hypothetical protein Bbelb_363300 [Branchiostoma belcheri]|nr:hypothetical protein Bbelb_363300 [Branchiostoma belcheri]